MKRFMTRWRAGAKPMTKKRQNQLLMLRPKLRSTLLPVRDWVQRSKIWSLRWRKIRKLWTRPQPFVKSSWQNSMLRRRTPWNPSLLSKRPSQFCRSIRVGRSCNYRRATFWGWQPHCNTNCRNMQLCSGVSLRLHKKRAAATFIQAPQDYFDAKPTFKQSYAPQSGEIFGILTQMLETFEANLSQSQKEEMANQKAYED